MLEFDGRRRVFKSVLLMLSFVRIARQQAYAGKQQQFQVQIRVDDNVVERSGLKRDNKTTVQIDDSQEAKSLINSAPVTMGVPVLLILRGILTLVQIWSIAAEMVREFYYGGVIIDATKTPIDIRNSKSVPAGLVFVLPPTGPVQKFKASEFSQARLGETLSGK